MNHTLTAIALIGLSACSCVLGDSDETAQAEDAPGIVLGYIPGWNEIDYMDLPWEQMTHAAHAFVGANEDGSLAPQDGVPDPQLAMAAHEHGVKLILSIGGAASDVYLNPMAQSPDSLSRFIGEVIEAVRANDYDGIDLDWEHPQTEQAQEGYARLLKGLRAALDDLSKQNGGRPYLLTTAVNGWRFGVPGEVFTENCDFVNVMTYDIIGPWSNYLGHHARLTASQTDINNGSDLSIESAMLFWSQTKGVPAEKLLVGLPFYARGFRELTPYSVVEEKNSELHTIYIYSELAKKLEQGWTRQWNVENRAPWMTSPDGGESVGFDDPESIAGKVRWARDHGYGVMIWAIGQDRLSDGSYPLIQAVSDEMLWDK